MAPRGNRWLLRACVVVLGVAFGRSAEAAEATPTGDWEAPEASEHVVPRLDRNTREVFTNLLYEGNNRAMRGPFDPRPEDGCEDAERYRELAARTAGVFVLRDALFSQQDHPIEHRSCALMMPSNWVSIAVHQTLDGKPLVAPRAPALEDDRAWAAISSAREMFGSFQASGSLFRWATRPLRGASRSHRARILNARHAVLVLAAGAEKLVAAADAGAIEVARVGAELIAASDRAYFGEGIRRDHVIPLVVENPNRDEIVRERKGLVVHGRTLRPEAVELARDTIYARRLRDGPIAVERYDITSSADVERLVTVLERLVPRGSKGHRVYVWVGGPTVRGTKRVRAAEQALPAFVERLRMESIEESRVVVFARPVFQTRRSDRARLHAFVERLGDMGVLAGVNMQGPVLRSWMGWTTSSATTARK